MSKAWTGSAVQGRCLRLAFSTLLVCVLLAGAGACAPDPGPDEAIRRWLADAQAAAESRNRDTLMEMIAASYVDARGNDRDDIDRMLRVLFFRNQSIVLASKIDEVDVFDDSAASVRLTAGMAGTRNRFPGLDAEVWRFELDLEKDGRDWLLIGARWGRLGENLR